MVVSKKMLNKNALFLGNRKIFQNSHFFGVFNFGEQGFSNRDTVIRDPRTKPVAQDQQNFENLGPIRTGRSPDLVVLGSLTVMNETEDRQDLTV